MQSDEQPNVFARRSHFRTVAMSKGDIEPLPVNFSSQNTEPMIEIEQLIEMRLKKIELTGLGTRFRLHGRLKLQGFGAEKQNPLQSLC